MQQVRAGVRMPKEIKNSRKPYERTRQQELLDDDAFSVLYARLSMGNGYGEYTIYGNGLFAELNITGGRANGVMLWLLMVTGMLYC